MKKSVYSLVLMDDVVEAVDRLAASIGTSRSNLINRILAEHLACETPQQRFRDIFSYLEEFLGHAECFLPLTNASDAMYSTKTAIRYKYNPSVRYLVELSNQPNRVGELRVSFRTKSQTFLDIIESFFSFWEQAENQTIGHLFADGIESAYEDGRYIRVFNNPIGKDNCTSEELGCAIGEYISVFDDVLKTYINNIGNNSQGIAYQQYINYPRKSKFII